MSENRKICVGAIIGAHGVRGQVRLRSFTAEPEDVVAHGKLSDEAGARQFDIKLVGVMKDHFIATIKGVVGRDAAEALKGTALYVDRADLPQIDEPNVYYDADLIGLVARGMDGVAKGKIAAVHDYGAGSFLEIQPQTGSAYMLPFRDEFVPEVNIKSSFVVIAVPEGWVEEPKDKTASGKGKKTKQATT